MQAQEPGTRLSQLATWWTMLRQAHAGSPAAATAQEQLFARYRGVVYRYLLGALRDPHAADDLTQEFGLKLVRGDFRHAQPDRGRFRDYIRTVLIRMVGAHRGRQRLGHAAVALEWEQDASPVDDLAFDQHWREALLARVWARLSTLQPTYHAVLQFRANHPEMPSSVMALFLSRQMGKRLTGAGVRQTLHRARSMFAELLLEEVAYSLQAPTPENVERELEALELLSYCRHQPETPGNGQ